MVLPSLAETLLTLEGERQHGITLITDEGTTRLSYDTLLQTSRRVLAGLMECGLSEGSYCLMVVPDAASFLPLFWATQLGGIIPAPLPFGHKPEHLRRVTGAYQILTAHSRGLHVVAPGAVRGHLERAGIAPSRIISMDHILSTQARSHTVAPNPTGLVQFSSGSTGTPKGVVLSQHNLTTNIDAILDGIGAGTGETERTLSWMPLAHDMGLIGMHLAPLSRGWSQVIMEPHLFLRDPARWLAAMEEHRTTITASPNFGLSYTLKRLGEERFQEFSLDALKLIINGAEPISREVCMRFRGALRHAGVTREVIMPVYGLAEATVAVTFSTPNQPLNSVTLSREALGRHEVQFLHGATPDATAIVSVGHPVKGCELRIVDDSGAPRSEGELGEVQLRGVNVTERVLGGTLAKADEWLLTGDLGFLHKGELFITGRSKEMIIIGGANYYPHDLERIIEGSGLFGPGSFALSAATDSQGAEALACFVPSPTPPEEQLAERLTRASQLLLAEAGIPIHCGVLIESIPKTTSGKVQRHRLTEGFAAKRWPLVHLSPEPALWTPEASLEALFRAHLPKAPHHDELTEDHSFFALGGDSISCAQLLAEVETRFGISLPFSTFYERPTLNTLRGALSTADRVAAPPTIHAAQGLLPLPAPARRIFMAHTIFGVRGGSAATAHNLPQLIKIEGPLDPGALEAAISTLMTRHSALRSAVEFVKRAPYLRVFDTCPFSLPVLESSEELVDEQFQRFVQPFHMTSAPLFRAALLRLNKRLHYLMFDAHHLFMDGLSMGVLYRELVALLSGEQLPQAPAGYESFAGWLPGFMESPSYEAHAPYWESVMTQPLELLQFPKNPRGDEDRGVRLHEQTLSPDLAMTLRKIPQMIGVSQTALYASLTALLLSKVTGRESLTFGMVVSGRPAGQFSRTVGNFINIVPLRLTIDPGAPLTRLISETHHALGLALEHQLYQHEHIIKKRGTARITPYDVIFINQNFLSGGRQVAPLFRRSLPVGPLALTLEQVHTGIIGTALSVEFLPSPSAPVVRFEARTDLAPDFTESLPARFSELAQLALTHPEEPLGGINVAVFHEHPLPPPLPTTGLIPRLREVARENGGRPCLITPRRAHTYGDVYSRAEGYAQALSRLHPDRVIIHTDDPFERITLFVGALLAGTPCAFMDTHLSPARKKQLAQSLGGGFTLGEALADEPSLTPSALLAIDDQTRAAEQPMDALVLVFTSGTAGLPRAVCTTHDNIIFYMERFMERVGITSHDILATTSSLMVDISFEAIFGALLSGGALFMAPRELLLNVGAMEQEMIAAGVTCLTSTPRWLAQFDKISEHFRGTIICGGERLYLSDLPNLVRNTALYNSYGPTETTVACTYHRVSATDPELVPLGTPLPGCSVVVATGGRVQPAGFPGEIHIGGPGLTRGYFSQSGDEPLPTTQLQGATGNFYATGDYGWFDREGLLHFEGRRDRQVKLAGYRVELAEIERTISTIEGIIEATISAHGERTITLHASLTTTGGMAPDHLLASIHRLLPTHMVPKKISVDGEPLVVQDSPLSLPDALRERVTRLLPLYAEVLGRPVDPHTEFFLSGGDSLGLMALYARLEPLYEIEITDLFEKTTPLALAASLTERTRPVTPLTDIIERCNRFIAPPEPPAFETPYSPSSPRQLETIFITGGTGYVGAHLVREYLEQTETHLILALRGDPAAVYRKLSERFNFYFGEGFLRRFAHRLTPMPADLQKPLMGLTERQYRELACSSDGVIHAAALVKQAGPFEQFALTNHHGTQVVLGLAEHNPELTFAHLSTASLPHLEAFPKNPYLYSKNRAEQEAFSLRAHGAPLSIYRVGNVVCSEATGRFQHNIRENGFYLFVQALLEAGAFFPCDRPIFNFTFVDELARAIRCLFAQKELLGCDFSLSSPHNLSPDRFLELARDAGYTAQVLDYHRFERALAAMPPSLSSSLGLFASHLALIMPVLDATFPNAQPWLTSLGVPFSPPGPTQIQRMLAHGREVGFFPELP